MTDADRIRMAEILLDDAVEQVEQLPWSWRRRKQIAALRKVLEELRKEAGDA